MPPPHRHCMGHYWSGRCFYTLGRDDAIDHPDQRICEDVNHFTARACSLLLKVCRGCPDMVSFPFSGACQCTCRLCGVLVLTPPCPSYSLSSKPSCERHISWTQFFLAFFIELQCFWQGVVLTSTFLEHCRKEGGGCLFPSRNPLFFWMQRDTMQNAK